MESLSEIYLKHSTPDGVAGGDKGTVHSYIPVYEKWLAGYRQRPIWFMELGVQAGHSLRMWREYLHPESMVCGVDVKISSKFKPIPGVVTIECDATSHCLPSLVGGEWDVIIDDASHRLVDQTRSFALLSPRMSEGGLYVIEDVQDLDGDAEALRGLHSSCEIVDLRKTKGRYDDVLIAYRF